jgi:hypothetical protein
MIDWGDGMEEPVCGIQQPAVVRDGGKGDGYRLTALFGKLRAVFFALNDEILREIEQLAGQLFYFDTHFF